MANRPPGPTPPPQCRKSAVLVVTQSSSLGHVHEDGTPQQPQRQALVWSGKGHKATLLYNDLHAMDLDSDNEEWHQVYDHTGEKDNEGPVSRCALEPGPCAAAVGMLGAEWQQWEGLQGRRLLCVCCVHAPAGMCSRLGVGARPGCETGIAL